MMARYGMLQCGTNFKGTLQPICNQCSITDNEQHRLNICPKWDNLRTDEFNDTSAFDDIYKNNFDSVNPTLEKIKLIWNTKYANGSMNE